MERDGSVPRTRFCVRLRPPDGTNSSHRREYSAQMRDGVIRPNRWDDAEPRRKKSPLTFSPKPYRCLSLCFSPVPLLPSTGGGWPSHRPLPLPCLSLPCRLVGGGGGCWSRLGTGGFGGAQRGSAGAAGSAGFGGGGWFGGGGCFGGGGEPRRGGGCCEPRLGRRVL
jgi:hypothetical protein